MKCRVLVLCLVCVQVSATFYDELDVAMHSVRLGFGKLLSDVVVDVTDTVHCTISAVEHVLTLNGLMKAKSEYGHKCKDGYLPAAGRDYDPLENFNKLRHALAHQPGHRDIQTTISKVNSTLSNALDNHENQKKMESISKVLKQETDQLTKVSNILRQELNSISSNVNTELEKFEQDLGPSVWSELEKDRNKHVVVPNIHKANDALPKSGSAHTENKNDNNDHNSFNKVKQEFEHLRDDVLEPAHNIPKTFRDVFDNIRNNDDASKDKKNSVDNPHFDKYSPFYDPGNGNEDTHRKVLEKTLNIISDSQHNEDMISKLFQQAHVSSVFGPNTRFNF